MDTPYSGSFGNTASAASPGSDHDLQRVRDILFGEAVREVHARLDAMEDRLTTELDGIRSRVETGAAQLREAMDEQRSHDRRERDEQLRTLAEAVATTRSDFDARADALEAALRQVVEEQGAVLAQRLVRTEATLRDAKADRSLLADLLGNVAEGLRHADPKPAPTPLPLADLSPDERGDAGESADGARPDQRADSFESW